MQKLNSADSVLLSEAVNAVKHLKEIEIFPRRKLQLQTQPLLDSKQLYAGDKSVEEMASKTCFCVPLDTEKLVFLACHLC